MCIICVFLHSRDQHLCKFIGTKESVYIRKEFNSHKNGLEHQHGRRFIVFIVFLLLLLLLFFLWPPLRHMKTLYTKQIIIQYNTIQFNTVKYSAIRYTTLQCNVTQYNTKH